MSNPSTGGVSVSTGVTGVSTFRLISSVCQASKGLILEIHSLWLYMCYLLI